MAVEQEPKSLGNHRGFGLVPTAKMLFVSESRTNFTFSCFTFFFYPSQPRLVLFCLSLTHLPVSPSRLDRREGGGGGGDSVVELVAAGFG
ncbi:hypothetical protein Nepgr_010081 [Nepenthes gracilis]|uniref:Uncharacterized protein n=1 Tax=Nepenthes gracilis TaxID=150966 RepID=A0AAD3SCE6_NEPGR|nr:hypothetical protein Nepgr_010081 [Nepenthes gracilis]